MLSFFPRDVLDEIFNLIELVSKGFLIYSSQNFLECQNGVFDSQGCTLEVA